MFHGRRIAAAAALLAGSLIAAGPSQAYPDGPVTVISPFAPGVTGEVLAREVGVELSARLGQPIVVESKPGAAGLIGSQFVSGAAADGQTLLVHSSAIATGQVMRKESTFDVRRDLAPVAIIGMGTLGIFVNPSVPASSMEEFVAYAKSNPGALNYGSAGVGSTIHLAVEQLKIMTGIDIRHVPYSSGAQATEAAVAGDTQLLIQDLLTAMPHAEAGKLKLIAVGAAERSPLLPEVASVSEAVPGFSVTTWIGFLAPPQTPAEIVDRLNREVNEIVQAPAFAEKLAARGYVPPGYSPKEFADMIAKSVEDAEKVVQEAGIEKM